MRIKYNSKTEEFSRNEIILLAHKDLLNKQLSAEYIITTGYSSLIGFVGSNLANLDNEIIKFINKPFKYGFIKSKEYIDSIIQGYITRVSVDQIVTIFGLMEIADELSDDFIMKYVSPAVGTIVGISIGCLKYLLTWDKKKEENKFKYVALNGTISAVNSSFGVIYTYFDDLGYFTNIKTFKITKGISFYLTKFTKIVSKFLTKIFHVAIGTHTVAAIGCSNRS